MTSTKTTFLYVSPRGQDSSPGTEDQPLRTVQAAAERAKPGETVRILPGVYREWVQPPAGGTSDQARITFEGWGEGDVILTGAEPLNAWTHQEGDLWLYRLVMPRALRVEYPGAPPQSVPSEALRRGFRGAHGIIRLEQFSSVRGKIPKMAGMAGP